MKLSSFIKDLKEQIRYNNIMEPKSFKIKLEKIQIRGVEEIGENVFL